MSPALVLAVLFVLIGAQATRVLAPRRGSYPLLLALAVAGLVAAEIVAITAHLAGPALGVLHPVVDVFGIGLAEACGLLLTGRRRRVR